MQLCLFADKILCESEISPLTRERTREREREKSNFLTEKQFLRRLTKLLYLKKVLIFSPWI